MKSYAGFHYRIVDGHPIVEGVCRVAANCEEAARPAVAARLAQEGKYKALELWAAGGCKIRIETV